MYIFIFLIIIFVYLNFTFIENFSDITSYMYLKEKIQPNFNIKQDKFMNFLENINNSLQDDFKLKTKDTEKIKINALNYAFDKEPNYNSVQLDTISRLTSKDPSIFNSQVDIDKCVTKADLLCQRTNPYLYLNDATKFPPRWIGPYKNTQLLKETNLSCWNDIYNCCKKNI
jgi:hypothetical protein